MSEENLQNETLVHAKGDTVERGIEKGSEGEYDLAGSFNAIDQATVLAAHELGNDNPNALPVLDATEHILLRDAENAVIGGELHAAIIDKVEAATTFGLLRNEGILPSSGGENVISVMSDEGLQDELLEIEGLFAERGTQIANVDAATEMKKILDEHPDIDTETDSQLEFVEQNNPERTSNYRGNWTQLQTERTSSEDFKARYRTFIEFGAEGLSDETVSAPTSGIQLARRRTTKGDYQSRVGQYDALHENVTSKIGYGPASEYGKTPNALGTVIGHDAFDPEVVLFSDARHGETPLDDKGKDLIAAHEMYHGLIKPEGKNVEQVIAAFNFDTYTALKENARVSGDKIAPHSYMKDPSELMARMAQVKNYFAMRGGEPFTLPQLEYARKHYIEDTGLDNNMDTFLQMAKDEAFVELMNTLPI
ncbi:MAG: hypothetical protein JWO99_172 [Candidatus Saccharibacteria bacterium]|nr:hypothetical protein [Candidatus Saccharibacteria bacterium]